MVVQNKEENENTAFRSSPADMRLAFGRST